MEQLSPFGLNLERDDSRQIEPSPSADMTTYIGQQPPWRPGVLNAKVHVFFKEPVRIKAIRLQSGKGRVGTYYLQALFIHLNPSTNAITETIHVSWIEVVCEEQTGSTGTHVHTPQGAKMVFRIENHLCVMAGLITFMCLEYYT